MNWKELEPEFGPLSLSNFLLTQGCLSSVYLLSNLLHGNSIFMSLQCFETIKRHINSVREEIGGLLIGLAFRYTLFNSTSTEYLVIIHEAIPSNEFNNSPVSLKMSASIWHGLDKHFNNGRITVGWYHSHPNLGAFFSGTDRKTQKGFFNQPYSLGLVIDPIRSEQKLFRGQSSELYDKEIIIIK